MCYHVVAGRVLGSELTFSLSSYFLLLLRVQPNPTPTAVINFLRGLMGLAIFVYLFGLSIFHPNLVSTFRPWLFWFEHSSFIRSSNHMIHEHLETNIIFSLRPLRNNVTPQILPPPTFLHFFYPCHIPLVFRIILPPSTASIM